MCNETAMLSAAKIAGFGSITLAPRAARRIHILARPI
jgi:hypothetical protein